MINAIFLIVSMLISLATSRFKEDPPQPMSSGVDPPATRLEMASSKSPLLSSGCDYSWYPEFNLFHAECKDSAGIYSGQ